MNVLDLTCTEYSRLDQSCRWIELNGERCSDYLHLICTFITERLGKLHPALATKIHNYSDLQMETLLTELKARRALLDWQRSG